MARNFSSLEHGIDAFIKEACSPMEKSALDSRIVAQRRANLAAGLPATGNNRVKAETMADKHQAKMDTARAASGAGRPGKLQQAWDRIGLNTLQNRARIGDQAAKDAVVNAWRNYYSTYYPKGEAPVPGGRNVGVGGKAVWETDVLGGPVRPMLAKSDNELKALQKGMAVAEPYQASKDFGALDTSLLGRIRQKPQPQYYKVPYPQYDDQGNIIGFGAVPKINPETGDIQTERMIPGWVGKSTEFALDALSYLNPYAAALTMGSDIANGVQIKDYADVMANTALLGTRFLPGVNRALKEPLKAGAGKLSRGLALGAAAGTPYVAGYGGRKLQEAGVLPEPYPSRRATSGQFVDEYNKRQELERIGTMTPEQFYQEYPNGIPPELIPIRGYWNTTR